MATPTQPSENCVGTSAPLEESHKSPTTFTSDVPPQAKCDDADSVKFFLEACRYRLIYEEEGLKHKQEMLELHIKQEQELLEIRQKCFKARQQELELHQQAFELQQQLFESIRQEIGPGTTIYAYDVLDKMVSLEASFKPLECAAQRTEAEQAGEDAPTPEVSEPANNKMRVDPIHSRL